MKQSISIAFLLVASFCGIAGAQLVQSGNESGLPAFGSFSGSNLDVVSLQNGNLHIEIPIAEAQERGGKKLHWAFVYDSPQFVGTWFPAPTRTNRSAGFATVAPARNNGTWGWRLVSDLGWHLSYDTQNLTCVLPPSYGAGATFGFNVYTDYVAIEPNGTRHQLPLSNASQSCPTHGVTTVLAGPSLDGSGVWVDLSAGTMRLKDGTLVAQITKNAFGAYVAASTYEDSNGNTMSETSDMMNRNIVSVFNGPTVSYTSPNGASAFGPQTTTWTVNTYEDSAGQPQLHQAVYTLTYEAIDFSTVGDCGSVGMPGPCNGFSGAMLVPSKLTLPYNTAYQFAWVNGDHAQLQQITLPQGGYISYDYGISFTPGLSTGVPRFPPVSIMPSVQDRFVNDGVTTSHWKYSGGNVTDPAGNCESHEFDFITPTGSSFRSASRYETVITSYGGACGDTILKTVKKDYQGETAQVGGHSISANVRPYRITTTLDNGETKQTQIDYETFTYDSGAFTGTRLNVNEEREYDYGAGAPGALIKKTDYSYLHNANSSYLNANIVDRVLDTTVSDGSGNLLSQMDNGYDQYSNPNSSAAPSFPNGISATNAYQHDASFNSAYTLRGNVTSVSRRRQYKLDDGSIAEDTSLTSYFGYDDTGNVVATLDPLFHQTSINFADSFADASCPLPSGSGLIYPTSITNAAGQITSNQYWSCTGLIAATTDPNQAKTSYHYERMNRLTSIALPDGGSNTATYSDTIPPSFTVTKAIDSSHNLTVTHSLDGLGREVRSQLTSDPDGAVSTDTQYDGLGRVFKTSNPYRSGDIVYQTETDYDPLGRVQQIVNPDGTTKLFSYQGRATEEQDEGKDSTGTRVTRVSQVDALGHLTSVCEVSAAAQTNSSPVACGQDYLAGGQQLSGYLTSYTNDASGNLKTVTQGGLVRNFRYDTLSELRSATNPEAGTATYDYDADGDLAHRTRPVPNQPGTSTNMTTTYSYSDPLHRLTDISYTNAGAPDPATPAIHKSYDSGSLSPLNAIGRLTTETANGVAASNFSYDPVGRVKSEWQCTPQNCGTGNFELGYNYDYLGDITSFNNGSGATFSYSYNTAARLISMTSDWSDANHPGTLFSAPATNAPAGTAAYVAFGGLSSASLNNSIVTEAMSYTNRLQLLNASAAGQTTTSATAGSGSVTISGSLQNIPGTQASGTITISGSLQSKPDVTHQATRSTGSITISGAEQMISAATPGTGAVTINGTEQSKQVQTKAATGSTGSFTINGAEQSTQVLTHAATQATGSATISGVMTSTLAAPCTNPRLKSTCTTYWNIGSLTISINGHAETVYTNSSDTGSSVASRMGQAFNGDGASPVTTSVSSATIYFTSKAASSGSNYSISTSARGDSHFSGPAFTASLSGANMTGGTDNAYQTVWDAGNISVLVCGFGASTGYGQGDTAATIASRLQPQFPGTSGVNAGASGNVIQLSSIGTGSGTNCALSASWTFDSSHFGSPSFTVTPSGAAMTGGADAVLNTVWDSGTITVTVAGHTQQISFGQGSTAAGLASSLAQALSTGTGGLVAAGASGNVANITAASSGSSSNYSLSGSGTFDSTDFGAASFTVSLSGSTLTGGKDAVYDAGSVTVAVNGYSKAASYSQPSTTASIAADVASQFQNDPSSPVDASSASATVSFRSRATGNASNYSLASSSSSNYSANSFSESNSGAAMTGGTDTQTTTVYDAGNVNVTVNGIPESVAFNQSPNNTPAAIASALTNQFNTDPRNTYVTAQLSGNSIILTSKTAAAASDYAVSQSVSYDSTDFSQASFAATVPASLAGGKDPLPDSGTVTVTVNGVPETVSYGGAQNSSASAIVTALVTKIQGDASFPANASSSSNTLTLTSRLSGAASNYSLISASSYDTTNFSSASFATSNSGTALTGGKDSTTTTQSLYTLGMSYYPDGNVASSNDSVNGNWQYGYDDFSRIATATSNTSLGCSWDYDQYGNRWHQNAYGTGNACNQVQLAFTGNGGGNNNRIDGYCYDSLGNLLDAGPCPASGGHQYMYDAENRLISFGGGSGNGGGTYSYDAEGRRIRKVANGTTEDYLYDLAGHTASVLDGSGKLLRAEIYADNQHIATYQNGSTYFTHADWLGTERARSSISGQLCETTTSLPYGDGTATSGSCSPTPTLFTGKQRDSESGLDYFGARYYGSGVGRWLSADWSATPEAVPYADQSDPQTLNLYVYVRNNPTSHEDADGHCPDGDCTGAYLTPSQAGNILVGAGKELVNMVTSTINFMSSVHNGFYVPGSGMDIPQLSLDNTEQAVGAAVTVVGTALLPGAGEGAAAGVEEEGANLASRAQEIHSALDPIAQKMRTTAVADVTNADGTSSTVVASSRNTLSPAQKSVLRPGEIPVSGKGHAEETILNSAHKNNQTVNKIGVSRATCSKCTERLNQAGVEVDH